jgi:hypothetical protein
VDPPIARRAVLAALAVGLVAELLLYQAAFGVNIPILTVAVLGLATWFSPHRRPADPLDWWLAAAAIAAALGPALRTDPTVIALDLVLVVGGVAGWTLAVAGLPVTRRATLAVVQLALEAFGSAVAGAGMLVARAGADGAFARGSVALGRTAPLLRGLVVAVPLVAVFTGLFASADAVFGRGVETVLHQPFALDEALPRLVFIVAMAWLVGGLVALAGGAYRPTLGVAPDETSPIAATGWVEVPPGGSDQAGRQAGAPAPRRGAIEALTVTVIVNLLFAAFAIVQIVYLFGGASTLAAIGMSYSDYARQGYFQLAVAVGLAGLLLVAVHLVTGRTTGFLLGAFSLLLLIGVILASAGFRLRLYQEAYGWTELRFYVAASILWLGTAAAVTALLLWRDRMRWLAHGLAASAVAITLGVSAIGPHAFVTHENLARVLDPTLVAPGGHAGFDASYVLTLGDDAVPDLVAALAYLPPRERYLVLRDLEWRRTQLATDPTSLGWASWNLARERARQALAELPGR